MISKAFDNYHMDLKTVIIRDYFKQNVMYIVFQPML